MDAEDWSNVQSIEIIGSFADENKEIHSNSDIDILLVWDSFDASVAHNNKHDTTSIFPNDDPRQKGTVPFETQNYGRRMIDVVIPSGLDGGKSGQGIQIYPR